MTAAPQPVGVAGDLRVVCAAAGMAVPVPQHTSVLAAVRQAGLEVPPACDDARCGACETRVLEGDPDHRDGILTAEERGFGESMMICVSRARGALLVLDL